MANSLLPSPLEPHRLQVYCQQAGLVHHIWYHRANSIVINSLCSLGANPARGCNSRFEPLLCMAPGTRDALKLETFLNAPIPIRSLSVGHDNGQVLFKPLLVLITSFPSQANVKIARVAHLRCHDPPRDFQPNSHPGQGLPC